MPRNVYAIGAWPKIRLAVLERDEWVCQIQGRHCLKRATEADHIIPIAAGGAWLDMDNLRAACKPCNVGRVGHNHSRRWQSARTYITVVRGGDVQTSAYVQTHCQPSDLIVDIHTLTRTLGDAHAATLARDRLITNLRLGRITNPRAWITTTGDVSQLPSHRVINVGGDTSGGGGPAHTTHTHTHDAAGVVSASRIW